MTKKEYYTFTIVLLLLGLVTGCKQRIPTKINEVIFEKSIFSIPITLQLPSEEPPEKIEWLKSEKHLVPSIFFGPARWIDVTLGKNVKEILIRHGLASIEEVDVMGSYGHDWGFYEVLTYSEKIRPYIYKGDFKQYGKTFEIRLATRLLKSIDYVNEYKDPLVGSKIFAVKFSYTIRKDFPYLEELVSAIPSKLEALKKIDKLYRGKAHLYLDPSDGQWKLKEIILEDMFPGLFEKLDNLNNN